jgi:nondiscriminating glutamyl-tRNA synthetase
MSVRVRFAPSPTGDLHLGAIRSAAYNWLFARNQGGTFILRMEDTDQSREKEGSAANIVRSLDWLGISPDEGVCLDAKGNLSEKGSYGPYTQSKRLDIYHEHIEKLLESGAAYRCFCTTDRLIEMREDQEKNHQPPRYDRLCRTISKEEAADRAAIGEPFVVRQAMPDDRTVTWEDVVFDTITFPSKDLDDQVLLKSDGFPTYQLASVVDDHLMEISHVLRAQEWIPSTPKNLLLYEAFGWTPPKFAHLPVVLGPDRKHKLSKRDGAEPVLIYGERGYIPEAVLNFLAFLGWSPGTEEEFFPPLELAKRFSLERIQKAGAVYDPERLDFVNGWYIRQLPVEEIVARIKPYLLKAGLLEELGETGVWPDHTLSITKNFRDYLLEVAGAVQQRLKHFDESVEVSWFFFQRPEINDELRALIVPKKGSYESTLAILKEVVLILQVENDWNAAHLEQVLRAFIEEKQYKAIEVLWPIRAALTGVPGSPGTFEMLAILGKEESLQRLQSIV